MKKHLEITEENINSKSNLVVSPTTYTINNEDLVIRFTVNGTVSNGQILINGNYIYAKSFTQNSITFANSDFKIGSNSITRLALIVNDAWAMWDNGITVIKNNEVIPPTDNPPTISTIANINAKLNETISIIYNATDDNAITKHELSQNGGSSYSQINPTNNSNTYTHRLSYSSVGNRQCKIRVSDVKGQSVVSNNFTISVTEDTVGPPPTQNRPPTISGISVSSITSSGSYKLSYTINDSDNDKMTVELKIGSQAYKVIASSQSNGAKVYNGYGLGQGNHTCYLKVSDGKSSTTSNSFSINVSGGSSNGLQAKWEAYTSTLQALREAMHNATVKIAQVKADESVETSKAYTEAKFTVLNDSITSKVSQTEYNANKEIVNQKFTEIKQTTDSITSTVSEASNKADSAYNKASTLEQTVDGFEFKFERSGSGNVLSNSSFNQTMASWQEFHWQGTIGEYSPVIGANNNYIPYGMTGARLSIPNQTSASESLGYGISQSIILKSNTEYTISGYSASHRVTSLVLEIKSSRNGQNTSFVTSQNIRLGGADGTIAGMGERWSYTFTTPNDSSVNRYDVLFWIGGCSSHGNPVAWLSQLQIEEGSTKTSWRPKANEILSNTTTINDEGVSVKHADGSYTKMTSRGLINETNGINKAYLFLTETGTVNFTLQPCGQSITQTVRLGDRFRGKSFMSSCAVGTKTVESGYDGRTSTTITNVNYTNATFDIICNVGGTGKHTTRVMYTVVG